MKEAKKEKIVDIQYVTKCETCENNQNTSKQQLENKIKELQAKLEAYEIKGNIAASVPLQKVETERRSQSVPTPRKSVRLRSLACQTDMEMHTFADASTANPFYKDPMEFMDDSGIVRPPSLNIA